MGKSRLLSSKKAWDTRKTVTVLACAYAACVAVRFLLALASSAYPTINIDEFLYTNLARSIAIGEGLVYHGQPADYAFVVYPLVLSPVYLLFDEGIHLYRLLQLWNICLISLSVFPLFALAKAVSRDAKTALALALLSMLLPDFIIGQMLLSEAILYPLFFTLVYCAYRYWTERRLRDLVWIGVLGGLMYSTKPGQVVPAAAAFALCLVLALREKDGKAALRVCGGIACALAVIGAFYALVIFGFGYETTPFSLYDSQLTVDNDLHLDAFFKSLPLYLYYFILYTGYVGFLLPLTEYPRYERARKRLYAFVLLSLFATMLGTAWVVNRPEYGTDTIHMRYVAMYVPVVLILGLPPLEKPVKKRPSLDTPEQKRFCGLPWTIWAALLVVLLCTVIFGCGAGMRENRAFNFSFSLSILMEKSMPRENEWIGGAIILICLVPIVCMIRKGTLRRSLKAYAAILALLMTVNGAVEYNRLQKDVNHDLPKAAQTIIEHIGDDNVVLVCTTDSRGIWYYSSLMFLDTSFKQNACLISIKDLFIKFHNTEGVYAPLLPTEERGALTRRMTPDTNTFVMDDASFRLIEFAPDVEHAASEDNMLHIIRFTKGQRLAKSSMCSLNSSEMSMITQDSNGVLEVYDEALLSAPLTVRFHLRVSQDTTLSCHTTKEMQTVDIHQGDDWYEITFSRPEKGFNFFIDEGEITIIGYELVGSDA